MKEMYLGSIIWYVTLTPKNKISQWVMLGRSPSQLWSPSNYNLFYITCIRLSQSPIGQQFSSQIISISIESQPKKIVVVVVIGVVIVVVHVVVVVIPVVDPRNIPLKFG